MWYDETGWHLDENERQCACCDHVFNDEDGTVFDGEWMCYECKEEYEKEVVEDNGAEGFLRYIKESYLEDFKDEDTIWSMFTDYFSTEELREIFIKEISKAWEKNPLKGKELIEDVDRYCLSDVAEWEVKNL